MNSEKKQADRVALITGAGRRIGAAIARYLCDSGYRVVIHCHRSHADANRLAHALNQRRPNSALVVIADVSIKENAEKLIHDSLQWLGQLDLLVNNASIFARSPKNDFDDDHWNALFSVNVKAPFWLSHFAYPYLLLRAGAIINITDVHAEFPLKGYSIYCQSKAALAMQTKVLAREFSPHVRVNAIAPGAIAWPEDNNTLSEDIRQTIIERTLLKRHGEPLFIAQAVFSLADNPFITGQTLVVDGGRRLSI